MHLEVKKLSPTMATMHLILACLHRTRVVNNSLFTSVSGVVVVALMIRYRAAGNDWICTLTLYAEADTNICSSISVDQLEVPNSDGEHVILNIFSAHRGGVLLHMHTRGAGVGLLSVEFSILSGSEWVALVIS